MKTQTKHGVIRMDAAKRIERLEAVNAKLVEACRSLLKQIDYALDTESTELLRDETVKFRNGKIDVDASCSNVAWNECAMGEIERARAALANAERFTP